jgi:hypothetical protein
MAETTAVLDKVVFDFSYDIVDVLPVVYKVSVPREYQKVHAGQSVAITIHIIDNMTTYGRRYPFNPIEQPVMTLYSPSDEQLGNPVNMSNIGTGIYTYTWQTYSTGKSQSPILDGNVYDETPFDTIGDYVPGPYSARFSARNGSAIMITRKHVVFTILSPLLG